MRISAQACKWSWPLLLVPLTAAFCLIGQSAKAQQPPTGPTPNEIGTIYLSNGQVLAAQEPRALTKNASIAQFLCAPTGTRIGYLSAYYDRDSGRIVSAIGVATTQSGDNTTYFTTSTTLIPTGEEDRTVGEQLKGWTDDAAYFAFLDMHVPAYKGPDSHQPTMLGEVRCVDLVRGSVQSVPIPLDQMAPESSGGAKEQLEAENVSDCVWAPQAHLLAFSVQAQYANVGFVWGLFLYDADRQTTRLLTTYTRKPEETGSPVLEGWIDTKRLAYHAIGARFVYDLASDKLVPAPNTRIMRAPIRSDIPGKDTATLTAPGNVTLTLKETPTSVADPSGASAGVYCVSITRAGGSLKPQTVLLDSFPQDRSGNGGAQFLPNNGFDHGGVYHVVDVPFGRDLRVIDLIQRPATVFEKVAAGDTLTCPEEIVMAERNETTIGNGILRYAQSNGAWPTGDLPGVVAKVTNPNFPWVGPMFTTPNGVPFRYTPPAQPLAELSDPSNTPLGEFDLPCARVVLYADGTSRPVDKEPANGG